VSDEHQDWSHSSPIISSWRFCSFTFFRAC